MIINEKQNIMQEIPIGIQCDGCKKIFYHCKEYDDFEIQEFHHIRFIGGYNSIFGDGTLVQCDLCQHCLKKYLETILHYGIVS